MSPGLEASEDSTELDIPDGFFTYKSDLLHEAYFSSISIAETKADTVRLIQTQSQHSHLFVSGIKFPTQIQGEGVS